jgi:hypothetical protein
MLSRLYLVSHASRKDTACLQLHKGQAHVKRLVMPGDLLPKAFEFFLFADVFDCPDNLREVHLLIDQVLVVRFKAGLASLQGRFEIIYWEWQRLPKFFH